MKHFNEDGISFDFPDDWSMDYETSPDGWAVSLQSPGTAFAVIRLDRDLPSVEEALAAILATMKGEYPGLEATDSVEVMAGEVAFGHDMEFFSLDITNTCWTRCFEGLAGTVLVLCQVSDIDAAEYEPALRALCTSMRNEQD